MREGSPVAEERVSLPTRLFFLFLPIAVTGLGLLGLYVQYGSWNPVFAVLTAMVTTFFALGKFVVFASLGHEDWLPQGIPPEFLDPYVLAALVTYMDVMTSLLVAYNLDLLYKVPFAGKRLATIREHAIEILRDNRWLKRMAFAGVILFVAFPLTGTGAVAGTFVGKLAGLRRRQTLLAILAGALAGSFGMAFGVDHLRKRFEGIVEHPLVVVGCAVVLLVFFTVLGKMMFARREDARR